MNSSKTRTLHLKVGFLLYILDQKDRETREHSCRVAKVAGLIARDMGFTDKDSLIKIRVGGLLHDIGKVMTPDEILLKESLLTVPEMEEIRKHPVSGGAIIDIFLPELDIGDIAAHHHRHFDGAGYPCTENRRDICLEAKICSVADAFDTLRSGRFYKPAVSMPEALREIRRYSGRRYAPEVVEVLEKNAPRIEKLYYSERFNAKQS